MTDFIHDDAYTATAASTAVGLLGSEGSNEWKGIRSIIIFILCGICEIGGGYLIWKAVKGEVAREWAVVSAVCGGLILILYGFVATLQESSAFGRVYAIYGGFFIVLSYAWAAVLDGFVPDRGDFIGGAVALAGVCIAWFWPRDTTAGSSSDS